MRILKMIVLLGIAGLLFGAGLSPRADDGNNLTYITFVEPVELPGSVVLQPGTYAFVVLETYGFRNVVQVFDKDKTHLYATVLTIPNYRHKATDQTVVKFAETPAGNPAALKEWFYPANGYGQEFVYPKNRARELAKVSNEPVPSMSAELASDITKPAVLELERAPLKVEEPAGNEVDVAEAFEITPRAIPHLSRMELPKTGSEAPLIGLVGLFSVFAGVVLGLLSKRSI
jgi:LPXTG-motif cell wall-anchored protein